VGHTNYLPLTKSYSSAFVEGGLCETVASRELTHREREVLPIHRDAMTAAVPFLSAIRKAGRRMKHLSMAGSLRTWVRRITFPSFPFPTFLRTFPSATPGDVLLLKSSNHRDLGLLPCSCASFALKMVFYLIGCFLRSASHPSFFFRCPSYSHAEDGPNHVALSDDCA